MKIRPASLNDFDAWLVMVEDYNDDILDRAPSAWASFFSNPTTAHCLIVTIDDKPVAFLQYVFHEMCFKRGEICYISDLYVTPRFRRMGIARRLMKHMLGMADTFGWWRVYWITDHDNPARTLYDEFGIPEFVRYHVDL